MTRRRLTSLMLASALVLAIGWLAIVHPFGRGCVRQTDPVSWVLVDANGQNIPLVGHEPARQVVCSP